jgi:hypothetical protein
LPSLPFTVNVSNTFGVSRQIRIDAMYADNVTEDLQLTLLDPYGQTILLMVVNTQTGMLDLSSDLQVMRPLLLL